MQNLEQEVNMKATNTTARPVKVYSNVLDELENYFNPTQNEYVKTNLTKFVSEAVKEKLDKVKKQLPIKKSA